MKKPKLSEKELKAAAAKQGRPNKGLNGRSKEEVQKQAAKARQSLPNLTKTFVMTPMKELFLHEYLKDFNASKAALSAGYSKETAPSIGCQLLKEPQIAASIRQYIDERNKKADVDAEWVLKEAVQMYRELREANQLDLAALFDKDGVLKPIDQWPEIARQKQNLKSIEVVETFEQDKNRKKVFSGYLKRISTTDHKMLEAKLLEIIGKHVDVNAFNQEPTASQVPSNIILKVQYVDARGIPQNITREETEAAKSTRTPGKPNGFEDIYN